MDADEKGQLCEDLRDGVGGDGVGSEDQPWPEGGAAEVGAVLQTEDVDEPVAEGEREEGAAGGEEDVGAGPELLVDGEGEVPETSGEEADGGAEEEAAEGLALGLEVGLVCVFVECERRFAAGFSASLR